MKSSYKYINRIEGIYFYLWSSTYDEKVGFVLYKCTTVKYWILTSRK